MRNTSTLWNFLSLQHSCRFPGACSSRALLSIVCWWRQCTLCLLRLPLSARFHNWMKTTWIKFIIKLPNKGVREKHLVYQGGTMTHSCKRMLSSFCWASWCLGDKESTWNVGDAGSIFGSGRSPGVGNSNLLQYSCLGNPMDSEAWQATVCGVINSWTWLSTHTSSFFYHVSL